MSDASYAPEGDDDDSHLPLEERARIRGWRPLEEYKGDPAKWRDAEEFMLIGQDPHVMAIENKRLAGRLARVDGRIERLQKTVEDQAGAMEELRKLARRADETGYKRARAELLEERKLAVETGDTGAFEQIEQRLETLDTERRASELPPAAPTRSPIDPAITAFQQANASWFVPGSPLHKAMVAHFEIVEQRAPDQTIGQQLETAKKRVIADYPERFPREMTPPAVDDDDDFEEAPPPRRRAPNVAPPSQAPRRPQRGAVGFDTIEDPAERAEARQSFEAIKRGDPGMTEDEYLEIYNNPRADAIALRAARKA